MVLTFCTDWETTSAEVMLISRTVPSEITDFKTVRLIGGGREQPRVERIHSGRGAVVDQIHAVDLEHLRTAREIRRGRNGR